MQSFPPQIGPNRLYIYTDILGFINKFHLAIYLYCKLKNQMWLSLGDLQTTDENHNFHIIQPSSNSKHYNCDTERNLTEKSRQTADNEAVFAPTLHSDLFDKKQSFRKRKTCRFELHNQQSLLDGKSLSLQFCKFIHGLPTAAVVAI